MKILVIRLKYIGDVLLTSVICNSLKKSFPDAQIDYLMHQTSADLFQCHPYIDNVISISDYHRKHFLSYFSLMKSVADNDYDIIIDASSTAKTELVSMLARKAKFKIGRAKSWRGFFYTHQLPAADLGFNKLEQRLALLKPLLESGFEIIEDKQLRLALCDNERELMADRMQQSGVDLQQPVFVFAVSSREPHKQWRRSSMQAVIQHCIDKYQAQIVLMAGLPHEREQVKLFHQQMQLNRQIFSDITTNSLRELAALISHSQLFVGNEGGPRHISEAVGVQTVSIVSPSANKLEWLPPSSFAASIEWRDIDSSAHDSKADVKPNDPDYQKLYDLIKAEDVIKLIDKVRGSYE